MYSSNLVLNNREEYWLSHLRYWSNLSLFPREFGLTRSVVYKSQYLFLLSKLADKQNCYVSVFSERQLEDSIYDVFFLEARDETEDIEQVLIDRDMLRGVFDKYEISNISFFSGGRSYHFYVPFPPIKIDNFSATAREFVEMLDIGDLLDMHTVGNRRAMGRIPYTLNQRENLYAVYYNGNDSEELNFVAANCIIRDTPPLGYQDSSILKRINPMAVTRYTEFPNNELSFAGIYPDCVLHIMSKLSIEKYATHDERIHLAAYLHRLGFDFDSIVNAFSEARDFNRVKTEEQVRSIINGGYHPYRCERVKMEMRDVCPYSGTRRYCNYITNLINRQNVGADEL